MATKRPDPGHDSTMELSGSQLVAPSAPRPPAPRGRGNPGNDMSVWRQVVVGTDDFAPAASTAPRWRRDRIAIALGVLALAIGGAAYALFGGGDDRPAVAASSAAPATPAPAAAAPAVPTPTAAGSAATFDAAAPVEAPPADVASAADPASVDAISGVAPIIEKPVIKKKRVTKRPASKKRAANKRPKRAR